MGRSQTVRTNRLHAAVAAAVATLMLGSVCIGYMLGLGRGVAAITDESLQCVLAASLSAGVVGRLASGWKHDRTNFACGIQVH